MTEVADQFTEEQAGEVTRITHWIDGKHVEGASGRSGPNGPGGPAQSYGQENKLGLQDPHVFNPGDACRGGSNFARQ